MLSFTKLSQVWHKAINIRCPVRIKPLFPFNDNYHLHNVIWFKPFLYNNNSFQLDLSDQDGTLTDISTLNQSGPESTANEDFFQKWSLVTRCSSNAGLMIYTIACKN